jgi:nitrile hydratase accessory protein
MTDAPQPIESEVVFAEPWQAQAFAIAVTLAQRGCFTWSEWTATIAAEIAAASAAGGTSGGEDYYRHWLAALEKLVAAKGLVLADELARRKDEWQDAVAHTEFGKPVALRRHDRRHADHAERG